jgi:hypothetical protein
MRNAGPTLIAVARVATGGVGGVGLEAAYAVTASAPTTKTTGGMKAAATMKTASGMKTTTTVDTAAATKTAATATVETAAATKTAATATMKTTTAATAMARLGHVCEREPHDCARQDPGERQHDLFAASSSQHILLHPN